MMLGFPSKPSIITKVFIKGGVGGEEGAQGKEGEKGGGERRGRGVPRPQHTEPLNIKHSTISVCLLLQDPNMFSKWL